MTEETSFSKKLREKRARHLERHVVYRTAVAVGGFIVLLAGLAMLVLPGPGLLVTAIGLGMLALEFPWAERLLVRVTERSAEVARKLRHRG